MSYGDLKFGFFLPPAQSRIGNPSVALENTLQLIQRLDELGYEYAWLIDDPSPESLITGSPEVFIAAAIERTKTIKPGVAMTSAALQQPLALADRLMQMNQLAKGRITFCLGLDEVPSETKMHGTSSPDQRSRALECLDVLLPLLQGETVSSNPSTFDLEEARLKSGPYASTMIELALASQISPAAARMAGTYGLGLVSISATSAGGFDTLPLNWEIAERAAKKNLQSVDRKNWSLAGPVHIAETNEQAFKDVTFGLADWIAYFREVAGLSIVPPGVKDPALWLVENGLAVIGTADDAIAQIRRLQEQSGGFGCFLQMGHNWADREPSNKSIDLFARHVIPEFQSSRDPIRD